MSYCTEFSAEITAQIDIGKIHTFTRLVYLSNSFGFSSF